MHELVNNILNQHAKGTLATDEEIGAMAADLHDACSAHTAAQKAQPADSERVYRAAMRKADATDRLQRACVTREHEGKPIPKSLVKSAIAMSRSGNAFTTVATATPAAMSLTEAATAAAGEHLKRYDPAGAVATEAKRQGEAWRDEQLKARGIH